MTQRDIAKDKEFLRQWPETLELTAIPLYWIAQYEMMQYNADVLRARISELEALLHPNNRPDVISRSSHDTALETVFEELFPRKYLSLTHGKILADAFKALDKRWPKEQP